MSRYKYFRAGVVAGYGLLVTNAIYTLAGVPLALYYLSKAEFGLWAFVAQLVALLQLIELGLSGAFSRLIIDYKDKRGDEYGRMCTAAWAMLAVQGCLIALAGLGIGLFAGPALGVDENLSREFSILITAQCLIVGFGFCLKIFSLLLFAHHRIALTNVCQICMLFIMLGTQWLCFHLGWGVYSLAVASAVGMLFMVTAYSVSCRRAGLFPDRWLRPTRPEIHAVMKFGHNIFLIHIASQFIWAGQVLILTKAIGLEAAAVWAVCTRPLLLICQIAWKPIDLAFTFFSEMTAKGETGLLWHRYQSVAGITVITSTIGAIGYAACNPSFVEIWTGGEIGWPAINNLLLALWLLPLTLTRAGNVMMIVTKDLRILKWVYLLEAGLFFGAGYLAAKHHGITGMIIVFLVCTPLLTASYTFWRVAQHFGIPLRSAVASLILPALPITLLAGGGAILMTHLSRDLPAGWQLALLSLTVLGGSAIAMRVALSSDLKATILERMPLRLNGLAAIALGSKQKAEA